MSREDQTRPQFRGEPARVQHSEGATVSLSSYCVQEPKVESASQAKACPACGARFSGDARFCPFDGESLGPSRPWDFGSDPLLGSTVAGRYEIECVLGEGGMGRVYRARHGSLGRGFALKVLKPELASDAALAERFTLEAKAAASVSSPHVVQITDFGELDSGQPFFVMELLEGRSLSQVIRDHGSLSAGDIARIVRPLAEGLGAAHDAGVIHRDLKPDNVNVAALDSEAPIVKVLDFGLAKVAGASKLTRDGMVFGTPHYMSPEQAAGEPLDHRVDVYSLGVVMYEMATGRTPFEADTYMGVLTQHLHIMPTRPSELLGSDCLGALEDIILRCLAKRPSQRFDGMDQLVAELRSFERSLEASSGAPLRRVVRAAEGDGPPLRPDPGVDSLRNRETAVAPPPRLAADPPWVLERVVEEGRSGNSLGGPLSWVIAGGSVVSVIALIYLLLVPRNAGPGTQTVGAVPAARPSAALSACPPTVPASGPMLGSPVATTTPDAVAPAAPGPADPVDAPTISSTIGPAAATRHVHRAGLPRPAPAPPRRTPQAFPTSVRPTRVAPEQVQPAPSPVNPPSPSRLPALSGGDIVDPWAQ